MTPAALIGTLTRPWAHGAHAALAGAVFDAPVVVPEPATAAARPHMRGESRVVVVACVRVLWCCATAHRNWCLPQVLTE